MFIRYVAVVMLWISSLAYAAEFEMPFQLPVAPNASLLLGGTHDTAGGDRVESISSFASSMSPQDIVAFYQQALEQAGFRLSVVTDNGDYAAFSGKRERDRIRISAKRDTGEVEPGQVEIRIIATYDKP